MTIEEILHQARMQKCSDVHISIGDGIMFRRNGTLQKIPEYYEDKDLLAMIMAMTDDIQTQKIREGKDADFGYVCNGTRHRVNIYRQQHKLTAAIRIINDTVLSMEQLSLPPIFQQIAKEARGLVLLTGPTGSGKSTTLAAMIDYINTTRNCHILTIEDPIEYVYLQKQALIHQREIETDVDSFDTALRSAMREDPDVILVGEMRDYETISAVITLAETGHLVFSTLHTTGAAKTIDRIIDVFPAEKQAQIRSQLSGVLNAVVTQQLLPLADNTGRTAAFEIMIANDAIKSLIRENKGHQIDSMIQIGRGEGMISLTASLASLVKTGKVSRMTAEAYCNDKQEFNQFLMK